MVGGIFASKFDFLASLKNIIEPRTNTGFDAPDSSMPSISQVCSSAEVDIEQLEAQGHLCFFPARSSIINPQK